MMNVVIIGVIFSFVGVIGGFVCFIFCKVYWKWKYRYNIFLYIGYDVVGDYKLLFLMLILIVL